MRAAQIGRKFNVHYRLGTAYQINRDKPRAVSAFMPFLTYQTQDKAVYEVKARLQEL